MQRKRLIVRISVAALLLLLIVAVVFRFVYLANLRVTPSVAIPEEQLPVVTASAQNGDANSAARLSRHYLEKRNYRMSWIWMQRASRLGYPSADSDLTEMRKLFPPDATKDE
jgi:hypothetical protein